MNDITKLPDEWRERGRKNVARIHYKYADELEAAMPVGTIITEDESTWPVVGLPYAYRYKRPATGKWSTFREGSPFNGDIDLLLGIIWYPIPKGMFEPPEDK